MSPIQEQLRSAPIQEQSHLSPILEQQQKSPIEEQPHWSPPWTWSNPFPTPDVGAQAKAMKNVRGKSHPQQRKILSKTTKGKQ
jgi:hypothetical protein